MLSIVGVAQTGDTITDPIIVDGANLAVNVLHYQDATSSGMTPSCLTNNEDVYYKHTPSSEDNVVRIAMATAGLSFISTMRYQILKAPNGDINNLEVLDCDSYTTVILVGGSFEFLLSNNISEMDDYYLRVFRPTTGINLTTILNNTLISMTSSNTLSVTDINTDNEFKVYLKDGFLQLNNNKNLDYYEVYNLSGQKLNNDFLLNNNSIDIQPLSAGVYILLAHSNDRKITKKIKFIKT